MNNKNNNNNVVMATVKTIIKENKYMITYVLITAIVLFTIGQILKANAISEDEVLQFISYKHLAPNQLHEKYIGYHLTNDHVFLWYKNNDKNGFVLVQFLTDAQQKIQDETGIIQ